MSKHPMQKIALDDHAVIRFVENPIVRYLLENGGIDMNELAVQAYKQDWTAEDQMQFAQLIGYSVGGYADLSYASTRSIYIADKKADKIRKSK